MSESVIFAKGLSNLEKMVKASKDLGKQANNLHKPVDKMTKSMDKLNKLSNTLLDTFKKISRLSSTIALAGLGTLTAIGARGIYAQKQDAQNRILGLTSQQSDALGYAGKQSGMGGDYFKDIAKALREGSLDKEKAGSFSVLGMDWLDSRGKKTIDLLMEFFDKANNSTLPAEVLNETLQNLAGISLNELKALDLEKMKKDYKEGIELAGGQADKLKVIGEGVNRLFTSFQGLIDKAIAPLAPAIEKVFSNLGSGLAKIGNSKPFQELLAKIGDFSLKLSESFGDKLTGIIQDLPKIFRDMQIVFLNLIGTIADLLTWVTRGAVDKNLSKLSKISLEKASALTMEENKQALLAKAESLNSIQDREKRREAKWEALKEWDAVRRENTENYSVDKQVQDAKEILVKLDISTDGIQEWVKYIRTAQ